ncbi:soluble lytic murein transglycosylase-like protein [Defluviimonas denitrificans]|jgi:soluble lytic murein transglycosylase-like protein|uniref:Soluble lytic murein transglycosylase-like protein n=1 Tax=Albidovulum denitrificans TaxID=404881 RepID=A0A2S8S5L7_9RHOB|nr:transglycosylase SLT domain-containing protein [Defluviimonas denitrificans]PQV56092.1 soluble lytic murein transglycosylase-like protein [Defluviimonas denitrificans]
MRKTATALVLAAVPFGALAQSVPVVDAKGLAKVAAVLAKEQAVTAAEVDQTAKRASISTIRQDQLDAIDAVLSTVTGASAATGSIETLASAPATDVYAIDDNNPYANRLFGDARVTIEQMIIATAQKHGGHPALAKAGINPQDFRCWFQAMVKQESNFSIGARSPKAAFGLTQIIPGTAQGLGIYPAYYDDPMLQLDGGARYLLQQLSTFGSMPLALAAYNAGPGAVRKYGGIPPYRETQDYVVKITGYYNRYAGRVSGVDTEGTFDPRDMVIAEASNQADAGLHYGVQAASDIVRSLTRLREITTRIPATATAKEEMDLNAYARVEVARIAWMVQRLKAARAQVEHARYALLLQAYAQDEKFLQVRYTP